MGKTVATNVIRLRERDRQEGSSNGVAGVSLPLYGLLARRRRAINPK